VSGAALQTELERLPGVAAAALFLDDRAPALVYLATTPDADPAALGPVVVKLLGDRGVAIRLDRVHIAAPSASLAPSLTASLASTSGPSGSEPALGVRWGVGRQITLDAVAVTRRASRVECAVDLRSAGRVARGEVVEPDSPSGRARAAARATLEAGETLDPDFRFGLEGLRIMELFGERAVVVLVDATSGRERGLQPGVALVERSVEEAAALATLNALRGWPL
jgi:hypothetical protein